MDPTIINVVPPVLQLLILAVVALFVALSITTRFIPQLRRIVFRSDSNTAGHVFEYTIVPVVFFLGALSVVILAWDTNKPLPGESQWWRHTTGIVLLTCLCVLPSVLCLGAMWPLSRRADAISKDEPLKTVPGKLLLICLLSGIVLLPAGIAVAALIYNSL